jgi:hypothetical protein
VRKILNGAEKSVAEKAGLVSLLGTFVAQAINTAS